MNAAQNMTRILAVLALALPAALGLAPAFSQAKHLVIFSSPALNSSSQLPAGEILREIDDPSNGNHWLLVRNADHPAGPGLLLLVSAGRILPVQAGPRLSVEPILPVIRTGDRVVVEENTPLVEARLEAVAMSPGTTGSTLNLRLNIGGKVIRAVVTGPGRAILQEEAAR